MPITTKKGDQGQTEILFNQRLDKDDLRVEIIGGIDELSAYLGLAKASITQEKTRAILQTIQKHILLIGTEIAATPEKIKQLQNRLNASQLKQLENILTELEQDYDYKQPGFCLSGNNQTSATTDIARTNARRLERRLVTFKKKNLLQNQHILPYINRLSDMLFVLARNYDKKPTAG